MISTLRAAMLAVLVATSAPRLAEAQEATPNQLRQRIEFLESQVSDLEQRVRDLEAIIKPEPARTRPMPAPANWREITNWRQLRRGMTIDQVRALLGAPERVETNGPLTLWTWGTPNEARLLFFDEGLSSWSEPGR